MPLYELTNDNFRPIDESSFTELQIRERDDLQRMLRSQIEVLGDDLYVLTEEFGEWEDSRRRIDLLAIDLDANLVVIELKRTSDGGHMELQAIRYAAMVSTMTFERAEQIHSEFLARIGEPAEEARDRILAFLSWEEPEEDSFAEDVRIILVSEDFGKELTTAVLWLIDREIDICCIRLRPYVDGDKRLVDVQQIIPLPEANDYQVQIREKEQVGRKKRAEKYNDRLRFWQGLVAICRQRATRHASRKPVTYHWLAGGSGKRGLTFNYVILQEESSVELYIDRGDADLNKQIFDQFHDNKAAIEQAFGDSLSWERLNDKRASRIKFVSTAIGYRGSESDWTEIQTAMVDAMTKLESALLPQINSLELK
ncbi:MAG: DUF4268 domain-containing protein [Rubripirellula sp.]|nr:DUF4268 domain-containing protein [Rubripirellula sp.]